MTLMNKTAINIILSILFFFVSSLSFSQNLKGTKMEDRIGHGEDSLMVRRSIELYTKYYAEGYNDGKGDYECYKKAVEPWRYAFENAPLASTNLYRHGAFMMEILVQQEKDSIMKNYYFDLLMKIYDQRKANINALNSFTDDEKFLSKPGDIACRKAYDYYHYAPNRNMETAYRLFHEGIDDLGYATPGTVLFTFVDCYKDRYEAIAKDSLSSDTLRRNAAREDFINDYLRTREICDYFLEQAKQYAYTDSVVTWDDSLKASSLAAQAQKIVDEYSGPSQNAEWYLSQHSEAATQEFIDEHYATFLTQNDREKKNNSESSSNNHKESPLLLAVQSLKEGDVSTASALFSDAVNSAKDNATKAKYAYYAAAQFYKYHNIFACRQWCNRALNYKTSYGDVYLLIADCIVQSAPNTVKAGQSREQAQFNRSLYYCLAVEKCTKAKRIDPGCTARANRKISSYSSGFFSRSTAFMMGYKEGQVFTCMGERVKVRFKL